MKIVESIFEQSRATYLEMLSQTNIFIAPRKKEGVGVSVLEALAMGHVVIAHDDGTMNEYIENGQTGYLFDAHNPKRIDLANMNTLKSNSQKAALIGFGEWQKEAELIRAFVKTPYEAAQTNLAEKIIYSALYAIKLKIFSWRQKLKEKQKSV